MTANIESINEKVYVEFYDVINESAFNTKSADFNDTQNMKLLALHVFDVKDFAFDAQGNCQGHRILMPI
jgi:hypothetical protein